MRSLRTGGLIERQSNICPIQSSRRFYPREQHRLAKLLGLGYMVRNRKYLEIPVEPIAGMTVNRREVVSDGQ